MTRKELDYKIESLANFLDIPANKIRPSYYHDDILADDEDQEYTVCIPDNIGSTTTHKIYLGHSIGFNIYTNEIRRS